MSAGNERYNIRQNKSGDRPVDINQRSGDKEEGAGLFDLMASGEASPYDIVIEEEEQHERKRFLVKYFALLKKIFNRFEFAYVKQIYIDGADDVTARKKLCLTPKFRVGMLEKLRTHKEEIAELVEASDWTDAERFTRYFLASPDEIPVKFADEEKLMPQTVKGFGNLVKAWGYKYYRRLYKKEWYLRQKPRLATRRIRYKDFENRINYDTVLKLRELVKSLHNLNPYFLKNVYIGLKKCEELVGKPVAIDVIINFYTDVYKDVCERMQELCDDLLKLWDKCGEELGEWRSKIVDIPDEEAQAEQAEEPQEEAKSEVLCQTEEAI